MQISQYLTFTIIPLMEFDQVQLEYFLQSSLALEDEDCEEQYQDLQQISIEAGLRPFEENNIYYVLF